MGGLYGVIGDPVAHSLSPLIHRGWMRDLGIDADYRAFRVPADELATGVSALERDGVRGLNVTLPHKIAVAALCETVTPLARALGAVNTLTRTPTGGWAGDNTDHGGFLDDFRDQAGNVLTSGTVLVLGAGGAAQAVTRGLCDEGFGLVIANRTPARAVALAATLSLPASVVHDLSGIPALARTVDAVVNTLSAGHDGQVVQLGEGGGRLYYDISYGKAARGNLDAASRDGWRVADGLGMLVGQAALSFETWHGVRPDRATALTRCRQAMGMTQ